MSGGQALYRYAAMRRGCRAVDGVAGCGLGECAATRGSANLLREVKGGV